MTKHCLALEVSYWRAWGGRHVWPAGTPLKAVRRIVFKPTAQFVYVATLPDGKDLSLHRDAITTVEAYTRSQLMQ